MSPVETYGAACSPVAGTACEKKIAAMNRHRTSGIRTVNRHSRRASIKSIRHTDLITYLIPADVPLDGHATLHNAVLHWYGNIAVTICISCKASFVGDKTPIGAFLLALPVSVPDIVVTSAFCTNCHETLSASEVDTIATRVLRRLAPRGRFLDTGRG